MSDDVKNDKEREEAHRLRAKARGQALVALAANHKDEFDELLHRKQHACNVPHMHEADEHTSTLSYNKSAVEQ